MLLNNSCAVRFAIPFLCDISISDSGTPPSRSGKGRKSSFVSSPRDGFLPSPPCLFSPSLSFSHSVLRPFLRPSWPHLFLSLSLTCRWRGLATTPDTHIHTYKRIPDINLPTDFRSAFSGSAGNASRHISSIHIYSTILPAILGTPFRCHAV